MEIPSVVASEGHSASGSQAFGAQDLNPKIPALSEKEDHWACDVPLQEQSSPLRNDGEASSPWSESMSQLMIKLDQLNLDIEEALSASSSPCGTPGTSRKTQCDAVSKSASNQGPQDHLGPSGDRGEDPFLEDSSAPLRASEGTSGTTKRTRAAAELHIQSLGFTLEECQGAETGRSVFRQVVSEGEWQGPRLALGKSTGTDVAFTSGVHCFSYVQELLELKGSGCFRIMTLESRDICLRMDHRRRSGYRLGRIIARQQLLKKIAGGRRSDSANRQPFG
ncbi:unnamed protein product [Tetraodon nigroviridis]|uniref:(spotted green pufferfish) hypothetical protein n=1 Tax=Tetraodon nigroviridis TaxID=99883 RepID=Q4RRH1_TETNG|nr:unnamed protein product [Tetraodon nigroviridis]